MTSKVTDPEVAGGRCHFAPPGYAPQKGVELPAASADSLINQGRGMHLPGRKEPV